MRNQNIAPHYREYTIEKRKLFQIMQRRNQAKAQKYKEDEEVRKLRKHQFNLIRWDVVRQLSNEKLDEAAFLRKRRLFYHWWL